MWRSVEEVGEDNAFIFGLSADEVMNFEKNGGYEPMQYFNNDPISRQVLMQLINGMYSGGDMNLFRDLYDSLLQSNQWERRISTLFWPTLSLTQRPGKGGGQIQR